MVNQKWSLIMRISERIEKTREAQRKISEACAIFAELREVCKMDVAKDRFSHREQMGKDMDDKIEMDIFIPSDLR